MNVGRWHPSAVFPGLVVTRVAVDATNDRHREYCIWNQQAANAVNNA